MFERSGEEIKKVAKTAFYINFIIASIILIISFVKGFDAYYGGEVIVISGVVIFIVIIITAWVSSLFLYAFGDLVESNQQILKLLEANRRENKKKYNRDEKMGDNKDE